MRRRTLLIRGLTAGLTAALLAPTPRLRAAPEAVPAAIRIVRPIELSALPLLIVEHERLIERTAEAMGLGQVTVSWFAPDKAGGLDALAAGQADLAVAELVPFLAAADRETGGVAAIRALGAVAQRPYVLVTRNPAIRTIRDF